MRISKAEILDLPSALRLAVTTCAERCQYNSTKWAAELLNALPEEDIDETAPFFAPSASQQTGPVELRLEQDDLSNYLAAKAFFDCHEFQRCASVFLPTSLSIEAFPLRKQSLTSPRGKPLKKPLCETISQKSLFLACHALLIAGEKEKTEEMSQVLGPVDNGATINKQLAPLKVILQTWFDQNSQGGDGQGTSQGWLEYLYGVVWSKDKNPNLAISCLIRSVSLYPWNWGAWQELSSLIRDVKHFKQIWSQLKPSIMASMFSIYCRQELHVLSASLLSDISELQDIFPRSRFLDGQRALVFCRMKDIHTANSLFLKMLLSDPKDLSFLEPHSNVLHILSSRSKLASLSALASNISTHNPSTHCVIGNYYSLISRHDSAILHFRRALTLDRSFSPAWTLLGHEYAEVKNSHAAIDSYRKAVELDNKDYRAMVGLAGIYLEAGKPTFALFSLRRAVLLRPGDADLWQMMGSCFQSMSRFQQGIDAVKKGLECTNIQIGDDPKEIINTKCLRIEFLLQLATLYKEIRERENSKKYFKLAVGEYTALRDGGEGGEKVASIRQELDNFAYAGYQ